MKRYLNGIFRLCLIWWRNKVIHGIFRWIEGKYGRFKRTHEGAILVRGWTTKTRIKHRRGVKRKAIKSEVESNALRDTLTRVQSASWWK